MNFFRRDIGRDKGRDYLKLLEITDGEQKRCKGISRDGAERKLRKG